MPPPSDPAKRELWRQRRSEAMKKAWANPDTKLRSEERSAKISKALSERVTTRHTRELRSKIQRRLWADSNHVRNTLEYRQRLSEAVTEAYDDPNHPLRSEERRRQVSEQMRALWADSESSYNSQVWKDKHRAIMLKQLEDGTLPSNPKVKSGIFRSEKLNLDILYRSSWELEILEQLEIDIEVVYYDTEINCVPYEYDGVGHVYIPDVCVWYDDGDYEILEIKPSCYIDHPRNQAKFKAASWVYGDRFVVLTEHEIFSQT